MPFGGGGTKWYCSRNFLSDIKMPKQNSGLFF
jgi:hypothetical protein